MMLASEVGNMGVCHWKSEVKRQRILWSKETWFGMLVVLRPLFQLLITM